MIKVEFDKGARDNKQVELAADFVVAGGGISGICAAIAAAREGLDVVLVQDRPVLGGNASSEVRLWILGATSHMGNNNRWAREGGIIDEILVENLFRNKEGNPVIFDTVMLEKVKSEPGITLLLNTAVTSIEKDTGDTLSSITAFNSQNATEYKVRAPLFCDASGDGIVAFQAGAEFRMGAETKAEFDEGFAPDGEYGELLGHTIYFYSKNTGRPVKYVPPSYALKDIRKIPRFRNIRSGETGCQFWWFEYGGRGDTIHDTEEIKWELWSVVYGVWDYIKNSGKFPEAENLTLEWVGTIPGKRESRRFLGDYILRQQDIIEQRHFHDAVAFGGWAVDLHPADGVFSELPGCNQYHSKGIYQIPYRCLYSKDIRNLFIAGRLISASHVAFGSTRVMATCGHGAQAIGMAAALCREEELLPAMLADPEKLPLLQQRLSKRGQSIPGVPLDARENIAALAELSVSSQLLLDEIPFDGNWIDLSTSAGQLLPLNKEVPYSFEVELDAQKATRLEVELRVSAKPANFTPDVLIENQSVEIPQGRQRITLPFTRTLEEDQYGFLIFRSNPELKIRCSKRLISGILSVYNKTNPAVNNYGRQLPPENSGFESFEFWCPDRRPKGQNIAMKISPALNCFDKRNLTNGYMRPYLQPNAWVAERTDDHPRITLEWKEVTSIETVTLFFDTDHDHPMESAQLGHHEDVIPFCVRDYRILDGSGKLLCSKKDNYQTINRWRPEGGIKTQILVFEFTHPGENAAAALFEILIE